MPSRLIQVETRAGQPVAVGKTKVVPFSQSVSLLTPGGRGGLIWNRPVSILSVSPAGEEQVIPVEDVTRRIQITLLGAAFAWGMILWMLSVISKRRTTND